MDVASACVQLLLLLPERFAVEEEIELDCAERDHHPQRSGRGRGQAKNRGRQRERETSGWRRQCTRRSGRAERSSTDGWVPTVLLSLLAAPLFIASHSPTPWHFLLALPLLAFARFADFFFSFSFLFCLFFYYIPFIFKAAVTLLKPQSHYSQIRIPCRR